MSARFVFCIRPLSPETGFELEGEGILPEPLRLKRLIEAIVAAAQIGQGREAEVRILNSDGQIAEVVDLGSSSASRMLVP